MGDDFGVGFGDEFVALGGEFLLEGEVVFDDAVVDDDEGAGAVAVGVGVLFGGAAVGGPAGVADAEGAGEGVVGDEASRLRSLPGARRSCDGAVGGSGDGDAGGVIAAVFEAAQAFDDDGHGGIGADVSDDSTHGTSVDGGVGDSVSVRGWDFWGRVSDTWLRSVLSGSC